MTPVAFSQNSQGLDSREVFVRLPQNLKRLLTKADIQFVLKARQTYYELQNKPEPNVTAFLSVSQYIRSEASKIRCNISKEAIEAILAASGQAA